mmetsp:Transcript_119842/g.310944  ORF Transcript_119842/g.310944 Transcript_119842/m.310944 type:complete len:205 (+) Transcript_119842:65-679(+)
MPKSTLRSFVFAFTPPLLTLLAKVTKPALDASLAAVLEDKCARLASTLVVLSRADGRQLAGFNVELPEGMPQVGHVVLFGVPWRVCCLRGATRRGCCVIGAKWGRHAGSWTTAGHRWWPLLWLDKGETSGCPHMRVQRIVVNACLTFRSPYSRRAAKWQTERRICAQINRSALQKQLARSILVLVALLTQTRPTRALHYLWLLP